MSVTGIYQSDKIKKKNLKGIKRIKCYKEPQYFEDYSTYYTTSRMLLFLKSKGAFSLREIREIIWF